MKNLLNLGEILSKKEQKTIKGGLKIPVPIGCSTSCANKPNGTKCWATIDCECPGQCSGGQCMMY